jgi:hypothetical protein
MAIAADRWSTRVRFDFVAGRALACDHMALDTEDTYEGWGIPPFVLAFDALGVVLGGRRNGRSHAVASVCSGASIAGRCCP